MEEFNNINLKEQFLKMYVEEVTTDQLQYVNELLEIGDYGQINRIIEEYAHNIIYNKDLKEFGSGEPSGIGTGVGASFEPKIIEKKFSTEDMDPQSFELYCILRLIDQYENEQNKNKKELLHNEIQIAISKYRKPVESTPGLSR